MSRPAVDTPLSDEEYAALGALLAQPGFDARAMDLSALEGFLTAIAIGPNLVQPSQWLPWVWDKEQGGADCTVGAETLESIVALVLRHFNYMVTWMNKEPESFEPIYECGPEWGTPEQWCEGFVLGMEMDGAGWVPLSAGHPEWFSVFIRLGSSVGRELGAQDEDAGRWVGEVIPSVVKINEFRLKRRNLGPDGAPRPIMRDTPKVGRNDPCPCGSGKKYKKCCADGQGATA